MIEPGAIVDFDALWQAVAASFIAGLGVVTIFSLTVLGASRFADYRRDGRPLAATVSGLLVIVGLLGMAAAIVFGMIVMAS